MYLFDKVNLWWLVIEKNEFTSSKILCGDLCKWVLNNTKSSSNHPSSNIGMFTHWMPHISIGSARYDLVQAKLIILNKKKQKTKYNTK